MLVGVDAGAGSGFCLLLRLLHCRWSGQTAGSRLSSAGSAVVGLHRCSRDRLRRVLLRIHAGRRGVAPVKIGLLRLLLLLPLSDALVPLLLRYGSFEMCYVWTGRERVGCACAVDAI